MGDYLVIENLYRRFGRVTALNGLNLSVPKDSVTALVGANGAGKTTLFSLIAGFLKPQSGSIRLAGQPLNIFRRTGGVLGLLPQDMQFYETRAVGRQLYMFARLARLSPNEASLEVERVLRLVKLDDRSNSRVDDLSHGMRVRLGVAQALIGKPGLIMLDEPTAGLDPRMIFEFKKIIESLRGLTTLIISSHDLRQLEEVCDHVCIIDRGKVVRQGSLNSFRQGVSRITYHLDSFLFQFKQLIDEVPNIRFMRRDEKTVMAIFDPQKRSVPEVNRDVLSWLFSKGIGVLEVEGQKTLEQAYLEETNMPT